MAIDLRQSTASQEIPLGYFLDSTDGNTEETGLTIANTDIKIWKTGATTLANKNSGGATHISNGIYYAVLDATDTNTIGPLVIFVHVSGALAVRVECNVLDEAVYDVKYGTTAPSTFAAGGNVNVSSISNNAITAASINADAITAAKIADGSIDAATFAAGAITATVIATGAIDADALATDAVAEIVDAVWDELKADHTTPDTFGDYLDDEITSRGTGTALDAAGVRSAVGLASANLDTQLDALPTAAENADAVWDETLSGHLGAGSTGNALNAAGSAGDPWSTALPGAYGAGTAGKIIGDNINATISSRASQTSLDTLDDYVDTEVAAIKAKTDNLPADPADASDISASFATTDGLITTVDAVVDAIKAKTDSLTFTVSGQVDANMQYINDTALTGDGSATPWGPV